MADVATTYMGLRLTNPIIAGASELTAHIGSIKKIEEAGAGAIVIKSLFEEQIQLERFQLEDAAAANAGRHAEMTSLFPKMRHAGPQEHLMWVKKAKESVNIPVIASLNAVNRNTWLDYAKQLAATGIDGIELNFYAVPTEISASGALIPEEQVAIAKAIVTALSIPVSVKLSVFYSNPLKVITEFDKVGVKGVVLFNRMFQPDIDVDAEKHTLPFNLSNPVDNRLPMRYAGLLYGNLQADVCNNTGILTGKDVVKMILAGAQCVQVVSALYNNTIGYLQEMLKDLHAWMDAKGYASLADFRGKLSKQKSNDPWAYERAQYVKLLFESEELINTAPLV